MSRPADRSPLPAAQFINDATSAPTNYRRSRQRLSDEVRDAILQELIVSEATPPGERLPTEAELCARYAVSRVTIRAALRSLQQAGFIDVRQGLGSTVLPRVDVLTSGLDRLSSLESFAADQGRTVSSADLEIEEAVVDADLAAKLEIEAGIPTLAIRRVKLYTDVRVAWMIDYVPEGVLPFQTIVSEFDGSVLDVLLAHRDLRVEYSDCDIKAVALDRVTAKRLAVRANSPALYLEELTRTRSGRVVNLSQAWLLPEHFRFSVRRRRQFE